MLTNWKEAIELCKNLNFAGYNDWRLPAIYELRTIQDYRVQNIDLSIFENIQPNWYWTSNIYSFNTGCAWGISINDTYVNGYDKNYNHCIWPVRGGKFGHLKNLIMNNLEENQPLFTDNQDGTITDNRTSLMWTKNADFDFKG